MQASERHVDRAAMIEAASRSLRQHSGRPRDRPRSKGSAQERTSDPARPCSERTEIHSAVSSGFISDAFEESFEDAPHMFKRPLSRKKDPSASAAAGLGAYASPAKVTDAFEQRKARQPIPMESWGPRPPSRHGHTAKASPLTADLCDQDDSGLGSPGVASSGWVDGSSNSPAARPSTAGHGDTWAAARDSKGGDRRRDRKSKSSLSGGLDDGISGASSPNHEIVGSLGGNFGLGLGFDLERESPTSWASFVEPGALEVSSDGLRAMAAAAAARPGTPGGTGSCGSTRGSRKVHHDPVSVEEVDSDTDFSPYNHHVHRREATPPQVIVTRSSQRKDRGESRGREQKERRGHNGKAMPFTTNLDKDFLSLFAS